MWPRRCEEAHAGRLEAGHGGWGGARQQSRCAIGGATCGGWWHDTFEAERWAGGMGPGNRGGTGGGQHRGVGQPIPTASM
jgi:hypothetical protein